MTGLMVNAKSLVLILTIVLIIFGTQSSFGQTITASTPEPLTETTLHESVITLTLSGGRFADRWKIEDALSVSGINGVTIDNVRRVSDTVATVELEFAGNIDTDTTLTFSVEAGAIVVYDGNALTATLPVTAGAESLEASTEAPLTEATLHESVVTLTLNGRQFDGWSEIRRAVSVSGINGVTVDNVRRVSDTEVTIKLEFVGNIDADAILTLTVGADAIVGGYDKPFTFEFPVTAGAESLEASTEAPLTEATLHESVVTLTLSAGRFVDRGRIIRDAVSVSGIEGVTRRVGIFRISDTEVTAHLAFSGNIDTDATLTFIVEADAIAGYNGNALTATLPVTAVKESLEASMAFPLTEATLHGNIITLTLTGRQFVDEWEIGRALSFSGVDGVTFKSYDVDRVSDTVATILLTFSGNIDTNATLTLTVGADAIVGYDKPFTFQFPVTAVDVSLEASTETPLTEATLDGSIITLTLSGRSFADDFSPDWGREDPESVSGIDGVTVKYSGVRRVSDTEVTITLAFSGNIDEDATLTLTVGADAIVGYDEPFTFQFPVTAVEESLTASTEFPLTEATLDGSIITLSLNGRQFAEWWTAEDSSASGIDGVTFGYWERVSDTEIAIPLEFDGTDFDTDATLTFTVGASMANYTQALTAQVPVTAIQQSNATVGISPSPVISPNIGERLTLNLNIAGGENIAGYQATVLFDNTALNLVDATKGDYLPADPFFLADGPFGESSLIISSSTGDFRNLEEVKLIANTLAGAGNGDGTLATLTFEVVDFKASTLTLSQVYLVDANGNRWEATTESAEVTIPPEPEEAIFGDINRDGVVNIQDLVIVSARFGQKSKSSADVNEDGLVDIVDLVLVASAVGEAAAAPPLNPQALERLSVSDVQGWLSQARQLTLTDPAYLRGIIMLERLLITLIPKKTTLLPNYPNPFNPETWIPYHLSSDVDVRISIYDTKGVLVHRLDLGHQMAGYYTDRTKAAYWDGKNAFGERVASGVYFYQLSAGDHSATRKMLIRK